MMSQAFAGQVLFHEKMDFMIVSLSLSLQQWLADLIERCSAPVVWYDKFLQALQPIGHLPESA